MLASLPGLPRFFFLQFAFCTIHGSATLSLLCMKLKNKKTGEAWERG